MKSKEILKEQYNLIKRKHKITRELEDLNSKINGNIMIIKKKRLSMLHYIQEINIETARNHPKQSKLI
jgi:uncharacterized protein YeeX (DUF496 family)